MSGKCIQREASIHITENDMVEAMLALGNFGISRKDLVIKVKALYEYAKQYSISTRSIVVTNDRIEKKVKAIVSSSRLDADLIARLIWMTRRKMKHKGIQKIKPGTKDWAIVKEVAGYAVDFCKEFELGKEEGFREYIQQLVKLCGNTFHLNKLLKLHSPACSNYEAEQKINSSTNINGAKSMLEIYTRIIVKNTGVPVDYSNNPAQFIFFVQANDKAMEFGVNPEVYIRAQFEGLSFVNGIPSPSQLVGEKAENRLVKYMYENSIRAKTKENTIDWEKIKKAK